jgi:hypothetical protein
MCPRWWQGSQQPPHPIVLLPAPCRPAAIPTGTVFKAALNPHSLVDQECLCDALGVVEAPVGEGQCLGNRAGVWHPARKCKSRIQTHAQQ